MLSTPILFLVFNRPKETKVVFEAIKAAKPRQLFVSADGARNNRPGDFENVSAVREIIDSVDWDCEVKTNFREHNLGCKNAVSNGIDWFFSHVEEGIILEDDCLPHPTFFNFCESLLTHYRDNKEVMHIGGNNFQEGIKRGDGSYYFSKIPHIWGWACWRSSWEKYSLAMQGFEDFKKNTINELGFSILEKTYWLYTLQKAKDDNIDTWDYQWVYTILKNKGKCISPRHNLVTNIGFGDAATHTENSSDKLGKLEVEAIENIIHPSSQEINHSADSYWFKKIIPWQVKLKSIWRYFF